ncbi:MAG: helix-turn-helix transcriptional regulator [Clostridium tyrobutyricum]|jgi:transcriptional regulator with XRE-family HTH domain|uniref:helix-turn-helix domain-containing protein n=1 Tax=Clostridium tyrobutyricum TaxID=1519 RepID=UPI002431CB88|nr:helix-turn-helix transcriptional regulator [Clostridium tyrobutyricum]MCH4237513.1 helix-turn-helix transcriptional regulator [Clostridium tyrobutyricum]MCH4259318.1 helix-turn-helix transcriptional regulator [Clostridium tyrobutyricum]
MDVKKHIGDRIYDFRMEQGLTQEAFVKNLNIYYSRGHLSNIENGLVVPSAEFIYSVCTTYNISSDWLLGINTKDTLSRKEKILINKFRKLGIEVQQSILNLFDSIIHNDK